MATRIDTPGLLRHILQVLREPTNVVVPRGSPLERFRLSELRLNWQPFEEEVRIIS